VGRARAVHATQGVEDPASLVREDEGKKAADELRRHAHEPLRTVPNSGQRQTPEQGRLVAAGCACGLHLLTNVGGERANVEPRQQALGLLFLAVPHPELTTDTLLEGRVTIQQPRRGYRVNVDSLLLANFAAAGRTAALAVDLGAGVGALGLVLLAVGAARTVALVEADPELVALSRENLARATARGVAHACELGRQRLPAGLLQSAELVVCNPPFFPSARGTPARESARRSRSGELEPFLRAARALLSGPRARATFCYPAGELGTLLSRAETAKLVPKRLRFVHARSDNPARLALVELRLAKPGGLVVLPPLVEWNGRARTDEVARIVAGHFGSAPSSR